MQSLVKLYKQFFDCSNIIYGVAEIKKPRYNEPNLFILSIEGLSIITKTIVFNDSINKKIALTEYLCIKFLDNLKNKANHSSKLKY